MNQNESNRPNQEKSRNTGNNLLMKRIGVSTLVLMALAGGIAADKYANRAPQLSEKEIEFVAEPGDSTWTAAEHVKGIDSVDIRRVVDEIESNPDNAETYIDGLQPGETIVIPESVKR
ncbi:MAG: hypothetical protein WCK26_00170 [Candidatus Saccharibacteria bacterium]